MIRRRSTPGLVVTADDFGLSPGVDHGILEGFRRGIVRSTALLVNFPDVVDSVARLRQEPGLEVGIHLNLTAGPPVLPPQRVPSLVGRDGTFHNFSTFFARVAFSQIDWGEVALEWRAQFERGIDQGCRFTFITSHQHVHMLPEGTQICAKLAHEFGVGAVRLTNFRLPEMLWPLRPKALALAPFVPTARGIFQRSGVFCNTSALEIPPGNPDAALGQVCRTLERLDAGVHELICHPAYEDSMLEERDTYVAGRRNELTVLEHAKLRAFLGTAGIEQTTFRELAASITQKERAFDQGRGTLEPWNPVRRHS
jgi:chitin disaccharide deacetylase